MRVPLGTKRRGEREEKEKKKKGEKERRAKKGEGKEGKSNTSRSNVKWDRGREFSSHPRGGTVHGTLSLSQICKNT